MRVRSLGWWLFLGVLGVLAYAGYQVGRERVLAGLYAERLEALAGEYRVLRERYDSAVREAAVTELEVAENSEIAIVVRGADQVLQRIETPFDARNEVHVDFVVREGRLFIRRVYDEATPPEEGVLIDPALDHIDWDDPALARGLAVYRGGLTPGRWVVSTSGNGALDLQRVQGEGDPLVYAPEVRSFEAIERAVEEEHRRVSWMDVVAAIKDAVTAR